MGVSNLHPPCAVLSRFSFSGSILAGKDLNLLRFERESARLNWENRKLRSEEGSGKQW